MKKQHDPRKCPHPFCREYGGVPVDDPDFLMADALPPRPTAAEVGELRVNATPSDAPLDYLRPVVAAAAPPAVPTEAEALVYAESRLLTDCVGPEPAQEPRYGIDHITVAQALALPRWALETLSTGLCYKWATSRQGQDVSLCLKVGRIRLRRCGPDGITWGECLRLNETGGLVGLIHPERIWGDMDSQRDLTYLARWWQAGEVRRRVPAQEPTYGPDSLTVAAALAQPRWALDYMDSDGVITVWRADRDDRFLRRAVEIGSIRLRRCGPDGITWGECLDAFRGEWLPKSTEAGMRKRWEAGEVRRVLEGRAPVDAGGVVRFEDLVITFDAHERKPDGWTRTYTKRGTIADLLDVWDISDPDEHAAIVQVLRHLRRVMRDGTPGTGAGNEKGGEV